jgi:N-carbamoylputrescine amidase
MPKAGVAQFTGSANWEENIVTVRRLTAKAAEAGVNLLCFPELANTVYVPFIEDQSLFRLAEPENGESVSAASAIARQHEMVLVYPFFERDGDKFYNSAIVFGPRGEKLTKYRKHTVPSSRLFEAATEQFYFRQGDLGFPVVSTPFGVRVGVIICYDRNLPEPARCAALNGAELLFVPVTTTERARSRWELLLRARAVENVMFVAAANRVGKDKGGAPDAFYFGESLIVDPRGEIIGHGSASQEDLIVAELELEHLRKQRLSWRFFEDRRPNEYTPLTRASSTFAVRSRQLAR